MIPRLRRLLFHGVWEIHVRSLMHIGLESERDAILSFSRDHVMQRKVTSRRFLQRQREEAWRERICQIRRKWLLIIKIAKFNVPCFAPAAARNVSLSTLFKIHRMNVSNVPP